MAFATPALAITVKFSAAVAEIVFSVVARAIESLHGWMEKGVPLANDLCGNFPGINFAGLAT